MISKLTVTRPNNLTDRVATGLGLDPVRFQDMVCQIVEYVGYGDEIEHFLQQKIRKIAKKMLRKKVDALFETASDINDEFAAKFKERLENLQSYYNSPEWLKVTDGEWEYHLKTAEISRITKVRDRVIIHMVGQSENNFLEVTTEQWDERVTRLGSQVLSPPIPF